MDEQSIRSKLVEDFTRLSVNSQIAFLNSMANTVAGRGEMNTDQLTSGPKLVEDFTRLAITSQIAFLDSMARVIDSTSQNFPTDHFRQLSKAYARAGLQIARSQSDAMKNFSKSLKAILESLEEPTPTPEREPTPTPEKGQ